MKNSGFYLCLALIGSLLGSCRFPDSAYPDYGITISTYCGSDPNRQCLLVYLGKLENPSQYRVVMTTTEYPDNAPPYAGATTITPLSTDYTFHNPAPNAQRDPFLLQPNQFNVRIELNAVKVKPAAPLYFYLIQVSGTGYVASGKPHITAIAEPYKP